MIDGQTHTLCECCIHDADPVKEDPCSGCVEGDKFESAAKALCLKLAVSHDAIAAKAQKDSYARDRAESMAKACRECAQEVGR